MLKKLWTVVPVLVTGLAVAAIAGAVTARIDDPARRRALRRLIRHHTNVLQALAWRLESETSADS